MSMISIAWPFVVILAVLLVVVFLWALRGRSETQLAAVRQEMQNSLASQSQAVTAQINSQIQNLMQSMTQQLGQVRHELQTGVASTGQLATEAQREVARRLQSSTDVLLQMSQKIGEMQQASQELSKTTATLQSILSGVKTRGALGETMLETLLADALPPSSYTLQYRFASTGSIVDAVVRSGERLLCVDSKFPIEAYRRMVDAGEDARKDFSVAVRKHADSIAEKYILPHEHTLDYALMFVPSEGVYYEILMAEDSKYARLEEYCRGKHVLPVSPTVFCAFLNAVAVSLKGQKFEENTRQLMAGIAGLKKQIQNFADVYVKLGTHLRNAQNSYEDADAKLTRASGSLEQMSQGALPEPQPVQKVFDLPAGE